ncbi:uncharacterized protein LAESUDRAFT_757487 [Laetiporus sulphureus 93-53]|uniref:DRBM domain-containing protein n=1 Tax=Laetiporus sulphureus 93-53 TaxID=1314785 RepID=A0A165FCW9_9APHY|nr:uncharacterized protein LAESUDRAFT_757487 [Laetiporus sulphureus 93-53]KZT08779.1 hypothetical protein LAESUDRAFT_757487 [Laetiporus sulphureus 93-53]
MSNNDQYRMMLNNKLQSKKGLVLSWTTKSDGPPHNPKWTATALSFKETELIGDAVDGVEYGQGVGQSQGAAKEIAAKEALEKLNALNAK